ncbi:MAG: thioredoxin [Planctomycetota bacterium]
MSTLTDVSDSSWDTDVLASDVPVFVDFWAPWCGPCKSMLPYVEKLAEDYGDKVKVVKLNTQDNTEVAAKYGITSIPTFMLIKGGEVQNQVLGTQPYPKLKEFIDQHI